MSQRAVCFNCRRSEAEIPISNWRYQDGSVWVCSQCLPLLIHKLEQVIDGLQPAQEQEEDDGRRV